MPVADYKTYCSILDRARAGRFALPAATATVPKLVAASATVAAPANNFAYL